MHRAALAQVRGDVPATVEHAQRAMELALEDDHVVRAGAAGFSALPSGPAATSKPPMGMERVRAGSSRRDLSDALGATQALGDICIVQGRLQDALGTYQQSLELVPEQNRSLVRGTAEMHVGMSEVFLERLDLATANEHLQEAEELGEYAGVTQFPYRWRVAAARVRATEGDLDGALVLISEAERLYVSDFFPNVRPVGAQGTPVDRQFTATRRSRVGPPGGRVRRRRAELPARVRAHHPRKAASGRARSERAEALIGKAIALLGRLGEAATAGARAGRMIEILVLEALALTVQGDTVAASGRARNGP